MLCLDIGNSHIFGGVFEKEAIRLRFRHETNPGITSDQFGIFLKNVLRENKIIPESIKHIAICSVVPSVDYSIRSACKKYFNIDPFFLESGVKTGIKIKTKNPNETGSDLIAGAVGAVSKYPNQNIIIADFGTITTYAFVSKNKEFLGASFLPGFRLSMSSLGKAAKLFPVEIIKPSSIAGKSTVESIQSGLYYHQLSMLKEVISQASTKIFKNEKTILVGTGGFVHLLENEKLFDEINSDLLLEGLKITFEKNYAPL